VALDNKLRVEAKALGVSFFGVADLAIAQEAMVAQGGPAVGGYPRALSLGIGLLHAVVDQLPHRSNRAAVLSYKHHAYDLVNQRLDHAASRLAGELQRAGYQAFPIAASQIVDEERLVGTVSHKMAAHLAGLGWIGRSCLLVTPQAGPRVRWATILTDAPLVPTGGPMEQRCGTCQQCVEICPVSAFTGQPFRMGEPREVRYAAHRCDAYFDELRDAGRPAVCGLCLYVCPHGRSEVGTAA
jgi:epoxyqueuosine reductase QueG